MELVVRKRCLSNNFFLMTAFFMFFLGFHTKINADTFRFRGSEKVIVASNEIQSLFEKIYLSRKPLSNTSGGCPPAPLFFYKSKKYQMSFSVYPSMIWINPMYSAENVEGEFIRYFRVNRDAVDEFLKEAKQYQ
ncbi:MAG: hypothetical protein K6B46_03035 [Opitutales bacterium]|nr:hypothetical protein [Opitutales bacterium]